MRCQCTLTVSATMKGSCDHKAGDCRNKVKKEFKGQGQKLELCNGCNRQYLTRWRPYLLKAATA